MAAAAMEEEAAAEEKESGLMRATDHFPFMLHVTLVLLVTWLFPASFLFLCICAIYLFQVEKHGRDRERRRIAFEERIKANTRRALSEGETLRWLNEGLKSMWPVCMEKFASNHFFSPMAPWFLNAYKPWSVKQVTLQTLALGSTPPVFNFIRALEHPQDGDHVVFEAAMEFVSGDDMNAEMSVQVIRPLGGFWTTFYISKLHIEGTVKFSVRFLEGWPVIGRVRFCFANAPYVTMTARPIYKKGVDMSLIPGAANWLEKTLALALEQSVVEPNLLVVDMEKLVSNMMWPDPRPPHARGSGNENKSAQPPTVLVEILEGIDLKAGDSNGFSDPYVEITLGQHHRSTKYKRKTLNPKWNEPHRIPIVNWDLPNLLTLRVRDKDYLGSDELGICTVEVKQYRDARRHELTLPLEHVETGCLRFAITVEYNNTSSPRGLEEPRVSGVGSQTVTQEMHTNNTAAPAAVHTSPGAGAGADAVMKRSKSDTNLKTPPKSSGCKGKKHARHSSTGEIPTSLQDQEQVAINGETSEAIDMPYGPIGTFSIQHPGRVAPLSFPAPRRASTTLRKAKPSGSDKGDADRKDREVRRSMRRFLPRNGHWHKRGGTGAADAERETAMSEQSGYTSSLDRSTELKVLNTEPYRGNVRMDLLPPDALDIAPVEPPLMFVGPSDPLEQQLEPILSGQERDAKTPAGGADSGPSPTTHDSFLVDGSRGPSYAVGNGSVSSGVLEAVSAGLQGEKELQRCDAGAGSSRRREPPGNARRRPPAKQNSKNMPEWLKKMTKLLKRSTRRKQRGESKGIEFSAELDNIPAEVYADGEFPSQRYHDDSDQSNASTTTQSFRKESVLDIKSAAANGFAAPAGGRGGESPELRKIINSGGRAAVAVSQSCRQESVSLKNLVNDIAPASQSFRQESRTLHRILNGVHPISRPDSALRTIPERAGSRQTLS